MGRRGLAIDLDPQFALTQRFGIAPTQASATAFELLAGGGGLADGVPFGIAPGLDLVAGRRELRDWSCRTQASTTASAS